MKKISVSRKMENRLAVGETFFSFQEFLEALNIFSKQTFVNFQKKGCRVINNNRKAKLFYNPALIYLNCKFECEFKKDGCPAMIKIRALNQNKLQVEESNLTHNHSCGIYHSLIRRTCTDLEKHLLEAPTDQKEMKLCLLDDLLEQWTKGDKSYLMSGDDDDLANSYVTLEIVWDVVLFIISLPPDGQLERITELRNLLDDWS